MANVKLYHFDKSTNQTFPIVGGIKAGFPSPADDFMEGRIDLNEYIIKNPSSTFFGIVDGTSLVDAKFDEGDLMVIDKSLPPKNGKIAVCYIDGDFTTKRLLIQKDHLFLLPENKDFKPIKVDKDNDFLIWGMVTIIVKKVY